VLVAGVLESYALFQWPSAFLPEAGAALVQNGAKTSAMALGAVFSTLLLLIYVPGAKVLLEEADARKREAEAAASEASRADPAGQKTDHTEKPEERIQKIDEMLKLHGFDGTVTQHITRFAQLLAPLLIAPMAGLLELLE
jgi:hypothetical protein